MWHLLAFSHTQARTSKIGKVLICLMPRPSRKVFARRISDPDPRIHRITPPISQSEIRSYYAISKHQMSALPAPPLGRPHSSAGSISNAPVSPVSSKGKRKRVHDLHSSPGSGEDGYEAANSERKRQPGVKRACNECRQQKVRPITRLKNAA